MSSAPIAAKEENGIRPGTPFPAARASLPMSIDIIGVWSRNAIDVPGTPSEEILVFKPDGTGWRQSIDSDAQTADLFDWTIVASDCVALKCTKRLQRARHSHHVEDCALDFSELRLTYRVRLERVASGARLSVLHIQLSAGGCNAYGLIEWPRSPMIEPFC